MKHHNYFEGWYFKHQGQEQAFAVIPALHYDRVGKRTATLQIITPESSDCVFFHNDEIRTDQKRKMLQLGANYFAENGIKLSLKGSNIQAEGALEYGPWKLPNSSAMGPFQWIYGLPCYSITAEGQKVVSQRGMEIVDRVAKATGRTVEWSDDPALQNGKYDPKTGKITLSRQTPNPILFVFKHELTHSIEGTEEYTKLQAQILKSPELRMFAREQGASIEELARAKQLSYAENGKELTPAEAMHEVVADYIGSNLFTSEKSIMTLAQENRSLASRIWEFLKKLKTSVLGTEEELWVMKAEELYRKALKTAPGAKENAAQEGGEKYAILKQDDNSYRVIVDRDIFKGIAEDKRNEVLKRFIMENLRGKEYKTLTDGQTIKTESKNTEINKLIRPGLHMPEKKYNSRQEVVTHYDEVIKASEFERHDDTKKDKNEKKAPDGYDYRTAIIEIPNFDQNDNLQGSSIWKAELAVRNKNGDKIAYDISRLNEITKDTHSDLYRLQQQRVAEGLHIDRVSLQKILSQDKRNVNASDDATSQENSQEKYSMGAEFDREYRALWEKYGERITAERGQNREDAPLGSAVTKKSEDYLRGKISKAAQEIAKAMNIPYSTEKGEIKAALHEAMQEIRETGKLSSEKSDEIFEKAYAAGVKVLDDYYKQYKPLRDEISKTRFGVTESDKEEFVDWADFRKKHFGKILTAKDGIPIDSKYMELQEEYPELFPESITHPGDQLRRIAEVRDGIEKTEISLSQYQGEDAEEFKKFARNEFDKSMNNMLMEINVAKRYEDDRAAQKEKSRTPAQWPEDVKAAYARNKELTRAVEKAKRQNLLTAEDRNTVYRLLRGELTLEQLPNGSNAPGIRAVYAAKKAQIENMKPVRAYQAQIKDNRNQKMEELIQGADNWKDKEYGYGYSLEIAERNTRDIIPSEAEAKAVNDAIFVPVHEHEAESNRLKNKLRENIRNRKIGTKAQYDITFKTPDERIIQGKVSESALVQLLGEGIIKEDQVKACGADAGKIKNAVQLMRKIYNYLFERINEVLIENGYEPVSYRKDYFPHFEKNKPNTTLGKIALMLGMEINEDTLPTDIAGLTHTFRPGKKWLGNFLQRVGTATEYDALEGFDRYLNTTADVIFHTEDIQNLRAFENAFRYKYSDAGTKKEIDNLRADQYYDEKTRESRLKELYERDLTHLGGYVRWLRGYTDGLAGKKSLADRIIEEKLNRSIYDFVQKMEGRIAANMIAGNLSSAFTNFIAITQGGAQLKTLSVLNALKDTTASFMKDDGFSNASVFLTNRKGSQLLKLSKADTLADFLSLPMNAIDDIASNTLVRARYEENLKAGMSENQALSDADAWAALVMGDRSKGAMPTMFHHKNPLTKALTMFQLEANNQFRYLLKDLMPEEKKKGSWFLALALFKYCTSAWLFNELFYYFFKRRPAPDLLGFANDTIGDFTGYKLPNAVELGTGAVKGEIPSFKTEKQKNSQAVKNIVGNVAQDTPFIGGFVGGGRLPIISAKPDFGKIGKVLDDIPGTKKAEILTKELLLKPGAYLLPPFGGGAAKKIGEGFVTWKNGGSFTYDRNGEKQLQFLAEQDFGTAARMMIGGKYATNQAQEYIDRGFNPYSAKVTKVIMGAKDHDMKPLRVKKLADDIGKIKKLTLEDGTEIKEIDRKFEYLFKQKDLNEEQRQWIGDELIKEAEAEYNYSSQAAFKVSRLQGKGPEKAQAAEEAGIDNETYLAAYEAQKKSLGIGGGIPAAKMKKKAIDDATPDLLRSQRRLLYEMFEVRKDVWGS